MRPKLRQHFFTGFALKVFISGWLLTEVGIAIYVFALPKTYRSTAHLKVATAGADPSTDLMRKSADSILSPVVLNNVIQQLKLNERWNQRYALGEGKLDFSFSEILEILKKRLKTSYVQGSQIITIESFGDRPDEAAQIANAVANAFCANVMENQTGTPVAPSGTRPALTSLVQMLEQAQPILQPYKPNIQIILLFGMIPATIIGAIAAHWAVRGRQLVGKIFTGGQPDHLKTSEAKVGDLKDHSARPTIKLKY